MRVLLFVPKNSQVKLDGFQVQLFKVQWLFPGCSLEIVVLQHFGSKFLLASNQALCFDSWVLQKVLLKFS